MHVIYQYNGDAKSQADRNSYVSIEECCLKTEQVFTPARGIRQLVQMKQDLSDDVHALIHNHINFYTGKYTCYVNTLKYYDHMCNNINYEL